MTPGEAIEEFCAAAEAKRDGTLPAAEDHALHARMAKAFQFLSSHGPEGLSAFAELLNDKSPYVRGWVGAQLLSTGNRSALPVIEKLAADPGIRGFSAAMTLKQYNAGKLRPPF